MVSSRGDKILLDSDLFRICIQLNFPNRLNVACERKGIYDYLQGFA